MLNDGSGLYLRIESTGGGGWILRYRHRGRRRDLGLGPMQLVTLAQAREAAQEERKRLRAGVDPIEHRRAQAAARAADAAKSMTFKTCAEAYINSHRAGWRNTKHAAQWRSTLSTYAFQIMGDVAVKDVDVGLVMKSVEPLWTTKPETASRLRGRIEAVLDWAKARGYRSGDNPSRWKGGLDHLLPARAKVRRVKHHAALPHTEIAAFIADLRAQSGIAARALEFTILCACRTGETLGATWGEFDLNRAIWTVPQARMKGGREHRVPLSEPVIDLLKALRTLERDGRGREPPADSYVFPGGRAGRQLSNMAMLALLRRIGRAAVTTHGFRASFKTWASEATGHPREVVEQALAHVNADKVEAAYQRGDMLERRRRLMDDWARYCETPRQGGSVVPIRGRR